ncbi:hypothetical protein VSS86_21950, partial [Bacillus safensis]|uniref:hypothetical protein n=1 Tax=Bacillus safensis TaxID=561879 RepID=UPI002DD42E86
DVIRWAVLDASGIKQKLKLTADLRLTDELPEARRPKGALDRQLGLVEGLCGIPAVADVCVWTVNHGCHPTSQAPAPREPGAAT